MLCAPEEDTEEVLAQKHERQESLVKQFIRSQLCESPAVPTGAMVPGLTRGRWSAWDVRMDRLAFGGPERALQPLVVEPLLPIILVLGPARPWWALWHPARQARHTVHLVSAGIAGPVTATKSHS